MSFKVPQRVLDRREEVFGLKYVNYDGRAVHVSSFKDRCITPEMKKQMRMNSYAQDDLPPKLDNAALIETAELYLANCSRPTLPCSTYNESLIHMIVPELIKRLKEVN